ncbi:protein ALWAYS EARLY [Salix suchowensis]|nr:protein ALWAYS EARLY [Salix suchowensis]
MELRPPPLDHEELKHLFTKTLVQDDMAVGLALVGDSYDYLASLPRPIYNEMVTKGLQIRMYPPNQRMVTICHGSGDKSFKLLKNDWAAIVKESGFEVGDKIACWACCHDLGGNFSLLIEKVPSDIECGR